MAEKIVEEERLEVAAERNIDKPNRGPNCFNKMETRYDHILSI